jgi:hypothetical protein
MDHLLEVVLEFLSYFVDWRTWLCVALALLLAYFAYVSGIIIISTVATFVIAGIIGLAVGLFWDARAG